MNRQFLILVATVSGLALIVSLLLFPLETWGQGDNTGSLRAVQHGAGTFLLVFAWLGGGFAAILFVRRADRIGLGEEKCRMLSFLGFKLAGFFFVALLIAGSRGTWGFGFWLGFIASLVGAFAVYLTFNPDLARRLAEAAKDRMPEGTPPAEPPAAPPAS